MPRDEAKALEAAISQLSARFAADPHLRAEVLRARRQFFGTDQPDPSSVRGAPDAAEQRFAEWFALERESEVLGAVPIDVPRFTGDATGLTGSLVGVALVLSADPEGVEARDLQDDELLDLAVPSGSLQPGDLLVGRLFAQPDGRWTPSAAAAVFRPGGEIGEAFQRDVRRVGLERRLWQIEIEHLLLRRTDQTPSPTAALVDKVPLERLEARLDTLLQGTKGKFSAAIVSQQLAAVDRPGQVMGPLLEELAFETTVDLDATRALLLEIWNAWHEGEPVADIAPPSPAPGETLGEQLVRALDDGLRRKRDVDDLFAQLERMAGLEPGASDAEENPFDRDFGDEEEEDDAPSAGPIAGDLGPLVQEYLWETGREQEPAAATLHMFVELQGNAAVPRTDLESVTGQDLMRLLLHCYLGAPPAGRVAAVRGAWVELQRFYEWAQQVQELDLSSVLQQCRGGLVEQVERLQAAGIALSTVATNAGSPGILEVEDVQKDGFGVRDDEGGNHWLAVNAATAALLRAGDLLLGTLAARGKGPVLQGMVVVLPTDARALME